MQRRKLIYVSGPITGIDNYREKFLQACEKLRSDLYNPVDPSMLGEMFHEDTKHSEYMKVALALLQVCDEIYMLEGWENSKGASAELAFAQAVKMPIRFQ